MALMAADAALGGLQLGGAALAGIEVREGFVKIAYTEPTEQAPPDSDAALLREGYATITELQPTAEVAGSRDRELAMSGAPFDRVM